MAGFDFDVPYQESEVTLLRALLMKLQRFCRSYGLEMHYRDERAVNHFYVTVDGPLPVIQPSVYVLARIMPAFAEGASSPPDRKRRISIAKRLIKAYWEGVLRIGEAVSELSKYLRGIGFPAATPTSFFFDTAIHDDEIDSRMWSLSMAFIAYENGEVGPPQMLEEIHTALEWVMQKVIGRSAKNFSYAQMVESLRDSGKISAGLCDGIIRMKDMRRGAKHRGESVDRGDFNAHLSLCLEAVHLLLEAAKPV